MLIFDKSITTKQIAEEALAHVENNYYRRINNQVRIDYFNDNQIEYLRHAINNQFAFPERLKLQLEFFNSTKMVVDELSALYINPPMRKIDQATEKDELTYEEILEKSNLNSLMDTNNKMVKLCKTTLIRPVWRDDQIKYVMYTPNMFDVIPNIADPTKADVIIYANNYDMPTMVSYDGVTYNLDDRNKEKFNGTNVVYHVWTKDRYFMFDYFLNTRNEKEIRIIDNAENEENINPYGTLDIFVPFRDDFAVDSFFIEGGNDLINTNESINVKKTELNYLTKMQGFSVPVRKGVTKDTKQFISDPSMSIDLPADDDTMKGHDFKFATPDAKIKELQDNIDNKLRSLAIKYKLNPEMFTSSGNRSSAESIQMQNYYLKKAIKRDKPRWISYETALYEATKIVYNTHSLNKLSENSYLVIDFAEVEDAMTKDEEDQHNLVLVNNDVMSKAEWLLKENPDIGTIEDAQKQLIKNREMNTSLIMPKLQDDIQDDDIEDGETQ